MQAYEIADLLATQAAAGRPYHEFLRIPALSVGLYTLPAGAAIRSSRTRRMRSTTLSVDGL